MSWLSRAAGTVSRGAGNLVKGVKTGNINNIGSAVADLNPLAVSAGFWGADVNPFEKNKAPASPGINPDLNNLKQQQAQYAKDFRGALPQIQTQMQGQLQSDTAKGLRQNVGAIRSSNSSRGLLYGGVEQGQEAGARASSQRGLISGMSSINTGLQGAADQMDKAALQTGIGIQQQQQSMQNQIYQNAMAAQAGQNQIFGSLASAGLLVAMA